MISIAPGTIQGNGRSVRRLLKRLSLDYSVVKVEHQEGGDPPKTVEPLAASCHSAAGLLDDTLYEVPLVLERVEPKPNLFANDQVEQSTWEIVKDMASCHTKLVRSGDLRIDPRRSKDPLGVILEGDSHTQSRSTEQDECVRFLLLVGEPDETFLTSATDFCTTEDLGLAILLLAKGEFLEIVPIRRMVSCPKHKPVQRMRLDKERR